VPPRADDHELGCNAPCLSQEAQSLRLFQVAVEVAREGAFEASVVEGKCEGVAVDELGVRRLFARDGEHQLALIEPDNLAA
jgi:hypothetical protein